VKARVHNTFLTEEQRRKIFAENLLALLRKVQIDR